MTDEELSITDATLIARLRSLRSHIFGAGTIMLVADRIEALVKENIALKEHVADMLAEQECGCGYDKPTDVCLGHLPLHRKTEARAEQLAATCERLEAALVAMRKRAMSTRGEQAYRELPVFIIRASSAALKGDDHE